MRISRGTLPSVVGHDGRRRVPRSVIERDGELQSSQAVTADLAALLLRLEALAAENGRLRVLTERADSHRDDLESQLVEARARIVELEARQARRWWRRGAKTAG